MVKAVFNIVFCTYFKSIEKFQFKKETYDTFTAFCVKSGEFRFEIDKNGAQTIGSGEVVICPPNKTFARKIISKTELCMIKFTLSGSASLPLEKSVACDLNRLSYNLQKLENCLFCYDFTENSLWEHYCKDILYSLCRETTEETPLSKAKEHFETWFSSPLSVSALAEQIGYSTAQFINKFKHYYGKTPKAFLSEVRIKKAKELLLTTHKTSKEIANLCGFSDEFYFLRFFKKKTSLTPKQFKKQKI